MRRHRWAAFAALTLVAAPAATATRTTAGAHDWTRTATVTPEGAFVLGNPRAKVRLVEYMSMTCSHCAHFSDEAMGPLTDGYIRKGLVALELRHAIRDGLDLAATLLARCNGAASYFPNARALLAGQDKWIEATIAFQQADPDALEKLPPQDALAATAHGAGLDTIMAGRGLPPARAKACLANKVEQDRLTAMAAEAWSTRQIPGTPAFLINGTLQAGVNGWAALEPKLKEALR